PGRRWRVRWRQPAACRGPVDRGSVRRLRRGRRRRRAAPLKPGDSSRPPPSPSPPRGGALPKGTTQAEAPHPKPRKKVCLFCQEKIAYVDYKDTPLLRKFISDRGKIRARRVTGNCTQHQRDVATAIKNAREMAMLPYTSTPR